MFDKKWFQKRQGILLFLLNAPVIKWWFRCVMCVEQDKPKLTRIIPNATFWTEEGKNHFDFRTHAKYSKRLYFGFYYPWAVLHFFDELFIDKYIPKWSFGFAAFPGEPYFPDAGTGNTTVDGTVGRGSVNQTFTDIRSGAGNESNSTATGAAFGRLLSTSTSNQYANLTRCIFTLDTSAIGTGNVVDTAIFSLVGADKGNGLGDAELDIVASTPASDNALVAGDYSQLGIIPFASIAHASFAIGSYSDLSFNQAGKDSIVVDGITKLGATLNWDTDNNFTGTWVSVASTKFEGWLADRTGTSQDPKLTGTFSEGIIAETYLETIIVVDTLTRSIKRALSEAVVIVGTVVLVKVISKVYSEIITIADTLLRKTSKVFSQAITIVDTVFRSISRALSDTITIVDTFSALKVLVRVYSEIITMTDSISRSLSRVLSNAIALVGTISRSISRTFSEAVVIVSTFAKVFAFSKTLTETIQVLDTLRMKINGLVVDFWNKTAKTVTTWTKAVRNSSIWTKTPKPED